MRRHALDVFHYGDWVFEDGLIDALQNVSHGHVCLMERDAVRIVDVAAAVLHSPDKLPADLKLACHRADIWLFAHGQSLFG
jgi:hypothetical protein